MGINMGAFLAPLTCGAIGENEGWQYGFLAAGIGMILGYLVFIWGQSTGAYEEIGKEPDLKVEENVVSAIPNSILPYVASAVMIVLAMVLITYNDVVDIILVILAVAVIGYLLYQAGKMEVAAKQRIWVIVILLLFTTIFWTFFELAGSALSLFTARNVDRTLFGVEINTTFFQSFNPLFIMALAPVFSWIWITLAKSNKEPSAPYKFGFGLLLLGAGFLALQMGGASAAAGMVPALFMVMLYLLHTIGELALSPVGLSLVTKLSPRQMVGFLMGIWFLSSSIAHQGGKHIAKLTTVNEKTIVESNEFQTSDIDPNIKKIISKDEFKSQLEEGSVEDVMVDSAFVAQLNAASLNDKMLYIDTVTVQELLDEANKFSGTKKAKMTKKAMVTFISTDKLSHDTVATASELNKLLEKSPANKVVSVIKNESLNKGLSVFGLLGWVAVGCGILLFLMGGLIKKWMHGIN
jgi:POT family proton-dependent oligopeptide transporter